jgi:uncharacterized membrane protein YoaK (UPF0700 family)
MMLGTTVRPAPEVLGRDRHHGVLARNKLLLLLTLSSGAVDAICFLGLGKVFTAFMTRNFVLLGLRIADAPGPHIVSVIVALCAFAAGVLGGMWAVVATLFVYRESHRERVNASLTRVWVTLLSFVLSPIYLLIFPFHPLGLAVLIGLGTFLLMAVGRDQQVVTTGITTAVVMVVAAVSPRDA